MNRFLIVGLGNPGNDYNNTKHNIGYMFLDYLAKKNNFIFDNSKFNGVFHKLNFDNYEIIFAKPTTYMNLSGQFVKSLSDFYKIDLQNILIIYDDMDLPFLFYKIKSNGSSGGQKGIQNIIDLFHNSNVKRLKLGIGRPNNIDANIPNYVLSKFNALEIKKIEELFEKISNLPFDFSILNFVDLSNKYSYANIFKKVN